MTLCGLDRIVKYLFDYTDDNECQRRVCDLRNSDCVNANGSLYCNCHPGYGDDGISCIGYGYNFNTA